MGDETGVLITQLISTNKRLLKLSIENNTINFKYIDEINAACAKNRQQDRDMTVPKYIKELGKLIRSTQNDYGLQTADPQKVKTQLYQQRSHYNEELHYLSYQHTKKAQEVFVKEEVIAGVIQEQTYQGDILRQEKENGEEQMKALDHEIIRLNRKEKLQEAALVEQLDNMGRRIEYEQLKNKKVKV